MVDKTKQKISTLLDCLTSTDISQKVKHNYYRKQVWKENDNFNSIKTICLLSEHKVKGFLLDLLSAAAGTKITEF